jgi:hypothetical protein
LVLIDAGSGASGGVDFVELAEKAVDSPFKCSFMLFGSGGIIGVIDELSSFLVDFLKTSISAEI